MTITYRRLVPVASRNAAGVSGAVGRHRQGAPDQVAIRRRRPGEVVVEPDDPPGGDELADAVRGTAGGACRLGRGRAAPATESAASSRSIASRVCSLGPDARARIADPVAVAGKLAGRDELADHDVRHGRRRIAAEGHEATRGEGDVRPQRRERKAGLVRVRRVVGRDQRERPRPERRVDVRRQTPGRARAEHPVHVETGLIRADGRGGQRRCPCGVSRRREMPRGGDGSSTTPPPATEPGDGRRRANRSPGAAGDGRVEAQDRDRGPVVEVDRLARAAHHQRLGLRRAQVQAQALAVGRAVGAALAKARASRRGSGTWRRHGRRS